MTDRFWEHKRSLVSTPSRSTGSGIDARHVVLSSTPNAAQPVYHKIRREHHHEAPTSFELLRNGGLLHLVWFRCPVPRIEPTRPRPLLRDKYSGCQICGTQLRPVVKSHDQGTAVPNGIDPFPVVIHAVGSEWVDTHLFSTLKIKHRTLLLFVKSEPCKICAYS
ncbi:uncharacterized protein LOC135499318 isoform X3 [Lineus longissimus]|uniref:uncharacterized protein LOC135499318 isoform X3 n=1 Tax=Lineus longissimus TaxID=88925 RepID=UPI00315DA2E3